MHGLQNNFPHLLMPQMVAGFATLAHKKHLKTSITVKTDVFGSISCGTFVSMIVGSFAIP
jgi:hypothetical protein